MDHGRLSRRALLGAAAAAVLGAAAGDARASDSASWSEGSAQTFVASLDGQTLQIQAAGDLDIGAGHIRMGTQDGNYEFEHSSLVQETHLNSYYIGTPTRTPISVGGDDGQDVLSFVVRGMAGQKNDLQQWAAGGRTTVAIDGHGRLRLGQVVLQTEIVQGRAQLVATLPDGTRQLLAS